VDDVMEELGFGPNGGMIYCLEFLMENLDWFDDEVGDYYDDYLIIDCPGQIELYTHIPVLPALTKHLSDMGFNLCATYLLEAPFVLDPHKYFSGVLSAMSAMIMLECPHINIMTKMDLIKDQMPKRKLKRYFEPDPLLLAEEMKDEIDTRFSHLTERIVGLIEEFSMVSFLPLDMSQEDSIENILSFIDNATQWAESQEPKMKEYDEPEAE